MQILKAYWYRHWHCSYLLLSDITDDHRAVTLKISKTFTKSNKNEIIFIGCTCGKNWYNPQKIKLAKD
jgi:hypothetical protein